MNKLTREDLIVLLTERNETKYAAALNELRNIGNLNLAVTKMYGYSVGDDLVIVYHYCFDGCHFYFEISDFNNLIYFYKCKRDFIFFRFAGHFSKFSVY